MTHRRHVALAKLPLARALESDRTGNPTHGPPAAPPGLHRPSVWRPPVTLEFPVVARTRESVSLEEVWSPRDRTSPQRRVASRTPDEGTRCPGYRFARSAGVLSAVDRAANDDDDDDGETKRKRERRLPRGSENIGDKRARRLHARTRVYSRRSSERASEQTSVRERSARARARLRTPACDTYVCVRVCVCMCVRIYARACINFPRSQNAHARGHGRHASALGETLRPEIRGVSFHLDFRSLVTPARCTGANRFQNFRGSADAHAGGSRRREWEYRRAR